METLTKVTKKVKSVKHVTIIIVPAKESTSTGQGELKAIQIIHPANAIDSQNTKISKLQPYSHSRLAYGFAEQLSLGESIKVMLLLVDLKTLTI